MPKAYKETGGLARELIRGDIEVKCAQCEEDFEMIPEIPAENDSILNVFEAPASFFKAGTPYFVSNLQLNKVGLGSSSFLI